MTNSTNNNDFNLQQLIDKVKAMVTPEKRAQMMTKLKTVWAVINDKPIDIKPDLEKKLVDSNTTIEIKPAVQEKIEEENLNKSEKNKL